MNQILIEGIGGTYDVFGLILTTGSTFPEAEPSEDGVIEVPGRSGSIDVTFGVYGDVVYKDIEQTLVFEGFERDVIAARRRFVNALSGRSVDYRFSWDPDYLMTGTWKFGDAQSSGESWARLVVKTRTQPYKLLDTKTFRVNAMGGIVVTLESGRKPVCPVFEFASETLVEMGDTSVRMQAGTYKLPDLWFREGANVLYLNSYLGKGNTSIADFADDTIAEHAKDRISDLAWYGIRGGAITIANWAEDTIAMHANETILESSFAVPAGDERYAVYIRYDWRDL